MEEVKLKVSEKIQFDFHLMLKIKAIFGSLQYQGTDGRNKNIFSSSVLNYQ